MKSKIRALLGSEMSIGSYEFKPIMLLLGILLFIALLIPLALAYGYLYIENTLYNRWKELDKVIKKDEYKGIRGI